MRSNWKADWRGVLLSIAVGAVLAVLTAWTYVSLYGSR